AIDISGTDDIANVVIEISTRQTLVSGVVDSSPGTASRSSVIVFPADPALLSDPDRWARWTKTDVNGTFAIVGLPSGDYLAVVLDDVDDSEWCAPEYLEPLRARAVAFHLDEGARKTLDLQESAR
ncbi:MAG TPA: hypothetical protein VGL62_14750, partial [Vicinamibacterales bacterium]